MQAIKAAMSVSTEPLYEVTIRRLIGGNIKLVSLRTAAEVEALRERGFIIIAAVVREPIEKFEGNRLFHDALNAVSALHSYALKQSNWGLIERASDAATALLRGSGLKTDESPSSSSQKVSTTVAVGSKPAAYREPKESEWHDKTLVGMGVKR